MQDIDIQIAKFPADLAITRELFSEYAKWLQIDLCFQDFEAELDGLPGDYATPQGCILLVRVNGSMAGCVALRPINETICEMKRMWVREDFQGLGLGRALGKAILKSARDMGYSYMRLDTLHRLEAAIGLYTSFGFMAIPAYYANPNPDVLYMELAL